MRSAASGIWNHSFSAAVYELTPFGVVCASAAEPSAVANTSAVESAIIVLVNIEVSPNWLSLAPVWCVRTVLGLMSGVNQPEVLAFGGARDGGSSPKLGKH